MLPNLYIHPYKLFGLVPIEPFGVLVGLALVLGYTLGRRRARKVGLDPELCADAMIWISVVGFVTAHLVSVIFYFPERILEDPLTLLAVWNGISSFGGFIGGTVAAIVFFRRYGAPVLAYADAIVYGLVPAWILGRMGCTIVFDHKGPPTTFFLGMADRLGQVHHNLGLYEALFAVVLTVVIYALKNVRPFDGFASALVLLLYSPVRFMLDFLRTADKLYWGLTPGHYLSIATFVFGLILVAHGLHQRHRLGTRPAEPAPATASTTSGC